MKIKYYINNEFIESVKYRTMYSPTDGSPIAEALVDTREDAKAAVDATYDGLKRWGQIPAIKRTEYLYKLYEAAKREKEELISVLMVKEGGIYKKA